MERPWSTIFDDELATLRKHSELLREAIIVAAVWTGKNSVQWDRLVQMAKESGISGLVDDLETIKRKNDADILLHSADPW